MEFLRIVHGPATLGHIDELVALYAAVFTAPPWNETGDDVEDFRRRLHTDADRPGFRAVIAGEDGFATSWTTTLPLPPIRAYQRIEAYLGPDQVHELLGGACEVDELAVRASARRQGLGRRLIEAATARAERAWLVTSRDAPDTMEFYRRVGWRQVPPLPGDRAAYGDLVVFVRSEPAGTHGVRAV
ncbi:GNAT family N-acetyltransferase [Catenuloplanes japonicus]|uniref:GNAT family N-acetyltransferase n=1 Tax=Catenuloplanes japonicus TaxID=33876 RepID=UPI000525A262|nr:GNAT family N-acetyltransferase [Catenuloplanes japonicus]